MKEKKRLKKKTVGVLAAGILLAGTAFLAAGCGDSSNQASDTTTQSTQAQTLAAGSGGMSVTEPDLTNVPIYPGAEKETMTAGGPGGAGGTPPSGSTDSTGSTTGTPPTPPSGGMGMSMVRYTASDEVGTVVAWYRSQLSNLGGFTESTGTFGPQNATQTVFAFDNGGTTITIMIGEGMGRNGTSGGTSISYTEGAMPAQPTS